MLPMSMFLFLLTAGKSLGFVEAAALYALIAAVVVELYLNIRLHEFACVGSSNFMYFMFRPRSIH